MLTRLENIFTFKRYEKWKVGEKLGSNAHPCYIRIRVITNRVISRFKCSIKLFFLEKRQGAFIRAGTFIRINMISIKTSAIAPCYCSHRNMLSSHSLKVPSTKVVVPD